MLFSELSMLVKRKWRVQLNIFKLGRSKASEGTPEVERRRERRGNDLHGNEVAPR